MENLHDRIVLIEGPTGSGKTQYIHSIGATPKNTLSSEGLVDVLLQIAKERLAIKEAATQLKHVLYFENMESLCGKEETQKLAAQLIRRISEDHRVILTGIDFKNSTPFFVNSLDNYTIVHTSRAQ